MITHIKNSKKRGDAGLGVAIGWFTINGYTVNLPLTDSQDYDLVVDDNGILKRVQVRTATQQNENKTSFAVNLRVTGGNRSGIGKTKHFDPTKVELLFVLTENDDKYLIPSSVITAKSEITVGNKYSEYRV